jgi:hypothetical protein
MAAIAPQDGAPTGRGQDLTIGEFQNPYTGMHFILSITCRNRITAPVLCNQGVKKAASIWGPAGLQIGEFELYLASGRRRLSSVPAGGSVNAHHLSQDRRRSG